MYLDACKDRLLLETESDEDSILINKNFANRQIFGCMDKKNFTERFIEAKRPKKVRVGFNIFSTLYPLKTVLN